MPEPTVAATLSDLGVALSVAAVGSAVAALWPWLTVRQRRVRFQGLICRELQEVTPRPAQPDDRPWWHHLSKRFVHEEIFARQHINDNRDFILSLQPDIAYHVNQLWTAYEKRDVTEWIYHLGQLSENRKVGSDELVSAVQSWQGFGTSAENAADTASVRTSEPASPLPSSDLFAARLQAYSALLRLTRIEPEIQDTSADDLTEWYYTAGNGLLLSGDALDAFFVARTLLIAPTSPAESIDSAMSALRTELKIDLAVRHPDERSVQFARPIDRRSF